MILQKRKSSQQQGREGRGCHTQWGWKETRRALGERTSGLICAVVHPGVSPAWSHVLQECCSFALLSAMVLGCPSAARLSLLQAAGPYKLFKHFSRSCHSPAHPTPKEGSARSAPCSAGRCCSIRETNPGCPRKEGNESEKHFSAQGKDGGSKQDAPHVAWQRLGAPKQTHAQAFALPQWIYRSDRAPSFSQLGDSSSSTQPGQHWSTFPCPCQPMRAGTIHATP